MHLEVSPHHQTVKLGQHAEFICRYDHNITWKFEEGPLLYNVITSKTSEKINTLKIYIVQLFNAGTYTCQNEEPNIIDNNNNYGNDSNIPVHMDNGVLIVDGKL